MVGSGITAPGDYGFQAMGSGISSFLRNQKSSCTIFVGSGTKSCHAFGIKDQKFGYKNGISDGKINLVTTLILELRRYDEQKGLRERGTGCKTWGFWGGGGARPQAQFSTFCQSMMSQTIFQPLSL